MVFKYRAITANCGNDSIGMVASKAIAKQIQNDQSDFYVINCQEVDFNSTLKQLKISVPDGYSVTLCKKQMPTHTKFLTQFHKGTGIATFIIHKKDLKVTISAGQSVRRSKNRLDGSAFNKGGLINDIILKNTQSNESIQIQTISGHLDSGNIVKRDNDWINLNKALAQPASSWSDLVEIFPHIRLAGYDANTRNKLSHGVVTNLWLEAPNNPDIQALSQIPLADQRFTGKSTYKTNITNIDIIKDKKRLNSAGGGSLDICEIADGTQRNEKIVTQEVTQIPPEEGSQRDHDVMISPKQKYKILSDFDRVKGQIAARLAQVAPQLAQDIQKLQEKDKNALVGIYQLFLSPDGLINKALTLHNNKLNCLYNTIDFSHTNNTTKEEIISVLCPDDPWFSSINLINWTTLLPQLNKKMQLTDAFISSLNDCKTQEGFKRRLNWYKDYKLRIQKNEACEEAVAYFKKHCITEYNENYNKLCSKLSSYNPQNSNEQTFKTFKNSGLKLIKQVDHLVINQEHLAKMDSKSLSQLNQILEQSSKAIDAMEQGKPIEPICHHLSQLSMEASGKASPKWQNLGKGLLLFACTALVFASILTAIPTGGASLLIAAGVVSGAALITGVAGVSIMESTGEKGLAKSISDYSTSITRLSKKEKSPEEDLPPFPRT